MNTIEMLAFLINIMVSCSAMPISEQRIGGREFQIQAWACQATQGPIVVKAWRSECDTGRTKYWGRLFYIKFEELHLAYYVNRFGEVQGGEGADVTEAYQAPCGS